MQIIREVIKQIRGNLLKLTLIYFLSALIIGLIVFVARKNGFSGMDLTRDLSSLANVNPFFGAISNLGILLWCGSAIICFYTISLIYKSPSVYKIFILTSGLLTAFLMFDDLFEFHEKVMPDYLGIPEKVFYISYFIIILSYISFFFKKLLKSQFIILGLAFSFFAFSILFDELTENTTVSNITFIEDILKFSGIIAWLTYFWTLCKDVVRTEMAAREVQ